MLFPDFNYVEYAYHGANKRGTVTDIKLVRPPKDGADHYLCLYRYREELKRYIEETGSIKGHDFPAWADYLYFDIDNDDLDVSAMTALKLIEKMHNLGIEADQIQLSFSGAKGFHVLTPLGLFGAEPSKDINDRVKRLALHVADGLPIDSGIYDRARLFRLPNTVNSKTGLYKVNLPHGYLLKDIADIKAYAATAQPLIKVAADCQPIENLRAIWAKTAGKEKREVLRDQPRNIKVPKHGKACIHRIMQGVPCGVIHNAAFRLANHFTKESYPPNIVRGILESWAPLNEVPAVEDFPRMIEEAGDYDYGCNDPVLKQFCDQKCHLYRKDAIDIDDLVTLEQQFDSYIRYVEKLAQSRFITGFPEIDDQIRGVAPGEVMFITAYSGVYKSAWLQNLLLNASERTERHHVFFSLEMPQDKVFERTVQIVCGAEGYTVENGFKNENFREQTRRTLYDRKSDKMIVCSKPALSIDRIEQYVELAKTRYDIGAIGIDYLGLMTAENAASEYARISFVAENSKALAKRLDLPVIVLTQVNRAAAATGEVEKWSAKGSGAIEASADYLLGMEKDDDEKVYMKVLKNRNGAEGLRFEVEIDKRCLRFVGMAPAQKKAKPRKRQPDKDHWMKEMD